MMLHDVKSKESFLDSSSRLMRIYSPDEEDILYLSPYTHITVRPDQLIIYQTLFGCKSILICDADFSERLISSASGGMQTEALVDMLTQVAKDRDDAAKLVENWIRLGVLE